MDKLIERLEICLLRVGLCLTPVGEQELAAALKDAITALTQDRAADDERVRHIAQYAVQAAGCSQAMSGHLVTSICQHFKTPPAQAEPKLYERHKNYLDAHTSPDTRNQAVADRRVHVDPIPSATGERRRSQRRNAGDRARWVVCEACDANAGCNATPPSQPAAEVEPWVDWFMGYTDGKPFDWCAAFRGDSQARLCLYAIIKRLDELDKRGVKP